MIDKYLPKYPWAIFNQLKCDSIFKVTVVQGNQKLHGIAMNRITTVNKLGKTTRQASLPVNSGENKSEF